MTLDVINRNVNEAGDPMNVCFWSPNQYNLAKNCLSFKRVLFTPHNTGKNKLVFNSNSIVIHMYLYKYFYRIFYWQNYPYAPLCAGIE